MIAKAKSKRVIVALTALSILSTVWIALNLVRNPMHLRQAKLDAEIESIPVTPLFILSSSQTDYIEIQNIVRQKNVLWSQLIAPPQQATPKDPGPNFEQVLSGVSATSITMTINGKPSAKITTPSSPRGTWVGVGDDIAGTKVVQITPQNIVVSMSKGQKEFKHNIPRK